MKAYKGFNKDLTCRGFQFEIGKEYEEDSAKLGKKGFHACEYPLDCFSRYTPNESRYCEVEIEDNGERESSDTKICGKKIKIYTEIGIKELISAAFEYIRSQCLGSKIGDTCSAITSDSRSAITGGYRSAITSGDCSAITSGDCSAITGGTRSAITGGTRSAITSGYRSAITSGGRSAITGDTWSAITSGNFSAITGDYRSAITSGDFSAITGGTRSAITGGYRSAITSGERSTLTGGDWSVIYGGKDAIVRGGLHSILAIQYFENYEFKGIKFAEVDGEIIKANVFYKLNDKGEFIEDDSTTSKTDK